MNILRIIYLVNVCLIKAYLRRINMYDILVEKTEWEEFINERSKCCFD